ncbi:MAG: hypothetical protein AVDCRST_MAG12-2324 [uncultured Rubrobacteraceae bacterium]|uniref:Uncharacterized protein n=1 Tax=uncultured Rubrobacteraceae bacterium TaxID=349277 RepID=A0A6J4SCF4_9ACTN|nr:MAG: hypothetical protein AVDCRST_MAG12-2324 [uncultured Rubrobacteraceae bacterium]
MAVIDEHEIRPFRVGVPDAARRSARGSPRRRCEVFGEIWI